MELQKFIYEAVDGVIYFSLWIVNASNLPIRDTFLKAFSRLSQSVLWKFEYGEIPTTSSNVFTVMWFPQQAILGMKMPRNCQSKYSIC